MEAPTIGLFIAFTAGLLSFLSPCVLPLVPSYVTFITGLSIDDVQTASARRTALVHGLLFTLGFSLIFIVLGAIASGFGQIMAANRGWISQVGGVVIIVFGLYLMGFLNIGWMAQDRRLHLKDKPMGYAGTVFVGIAFGAGWTPCIGPILGGILMYASGQESLGRGVVLLTAYSLGLAVPFILSALAVDRFMAFFRRVRRQIGWLSRGTGAVMVAIGLLMVTNRFTMLAAWLTRFTPDFLLERL
ncbi:MAG: sulfite exporter TauE/SafE family protein [Gemmatimonadaceae bacterium]|nr:sulfite exporter TauE/SafE family protein [Gemmatimonadaceae bacterium]